MPFRTCVLGAALSLSLSCSGSTMTGSGAVPKASPTPAAPAPPAPTKSQASGETLATTASPQATAPAAPPASPAPTAAASPSPTPTPPPASSPDAAPVANSPTPLTGLWNATGYTCDGNAIANEVIQVVQTGQQFVGKKITGDPCVLGGYTSFRGTINGGTLSVQFNVGDAGAAVQLDSHVVAGSYTPALIRLGDNDLDPPIHLTPQAP